MTSSEAIGDVEHVSCDYCGRDDTALLFVEHGFNTVKCKSCGLIYLNPRPKADAVVQGYEKEYFADRKVNEEVRLGLARRQLDLLRKHTIPERSGNPLRLLETGSATGTFLKVAVDAGFDVTGIDISEYACQYAQERFEVNVLTGIIEELHLKPESFDVVAFFDVLSHVSSPRRFFQSVARVLKPGGLMIARVGDKGGFWEGFRQGRWSAPEHLYHLSKPLVNDYLSEVGITTIKRYPAFDSIFPTIREWTHPKPRPVYLAVAAIEFIARKFFRTIGVTEDYYIIAKKN